MAQELYISSKEAAKLLQVTPTTIRNWCNDGILKTHTTPGGHRRFDKTDLVNFAKTRGIPIHDEALTLKKISVLVVDDSEYFREYIKDCLEDHPEIRTLSFATDGFAAGIQLTTLIPDVMLLDVQMPGMNGIEVCKLVKGNPELNSIRVIIVSGSSEGNITQRAKEAGAELFLEKPLLPRDLYAALKIEK